MLNYLSINNFILIDEFKNKFHNGLTTITGETGAGKSIILDAIGLLLGARADVRYFKSDEHKISLLAEFNIEGNKNAINFLVDHDFSSDNDCIIRRVITKEGKSKAYINSIQCTVSDLKKIGSYLVEIHSQNKSIDFLSPKNQIAILDSYSKLRDKKIRLAEVSNAFNKKDKILKNIVSKRDEEQSKLQLLNYRYSELKDLDLREKEVESLEVELKSLSQAESVIRNCNEALEVLSGDNNIGLTHQIEKIRKNIKNLDQDQSNIASMVEMIDTIEINATELSNSFDFELNNNMVNEERLNDVNERLNKIYNISNKNHVMPEKLHEIFLEIGKEIEGINVSDEDLKILFDEIKEMKSEWLILAKEISNTRKQKSSLFSKEITNSLNELKMEGSIFEIRVSSDTSTDVNASGIDKVEFLLSSNLGQTLQPMIASGGELSRISLAIQSIVSKFYDIPVIIFDEIDAGIGGTTANVIGKYLKRISLNSQVLCITHLPQVVVYGDQYITVKKTNNNNKSNVTIKYITDYELVSEVARMFGNETLDGEAISQSKKMISEAKDAKESIS